VHTTFPKRMSWQKALGTLVMKTRILAPRRGSITPLADSLEPSYYTLLLSFREQQVLMLSSAWVLFLVLYREA